jgi:hypothetical protein
MTRDWWPGNPRPRNRRPESILRAYLKRWKWEVGYFFGGVSAESPAEDVARIAPDHPIFASSLPATERSVAQEHDPTRRRVRTMRA